MSPYKKGPPQDFAKGTLDNKSPKISSFTSTVNSVNFVTICYMVISILRQWHDHVFYNELKKYAAAKALCCGKKNISIPLLFSFILFCFVRLQKFQIYFVKPTSQCNIILGFNHSESSVYVSGMVAWSLDNLIVGILIDQ